jgi:hypothetical protein
MRVIKMLALEELGFVAEPVNSAPPPITTCHAPSASWTDLHAAPPRQVRTRIMLLRRRDRRCCCASALVPVLLAGLISVAILRAASCGPVGTVRHRGVEPLLLEPCLLGGGTGGQPALTARRRGPVNHADAPSGHGPEQVQQVGAAEHHPHDEVRNYGRFPWQND